MKLFDLVKDLKFGSNRNIDNIDVHGLAYNASQIRPGYCFAALKGVRVDGHDFVGDAISRGAVAIISERPLQVSQGVVNITVPNTRFALALMSAVMFGNPSQSMKLVGVTGTNGKTTVTYLLEAIFRAAGLSPGVIGTIEYRFGEIARPAPNTTPESYDLQELLAEMVQSKVNACAMEVSSHALSQNRVSGCHFDAAIFTNLTPEHLDYHADMDAYFQAKALLFEDLLQKSSKVGAFAVINLDDVMGQKLAALCPAPVMSYGLMSGADVTTVDLTFNSKGLNMRVLTKWGERKLSSRLCGRFNAMNILCSLGTALKLGVDIDTACNAIESVKTVPGRFESIPNDKGILAIVDYAHTPDALENILTHARELTGNSLIAVFGCGGDRDHSKRPIMGEVAGRVADVVLVTSDNPRTEDPQAIIAEIMPGIKKSSCQPFHGQRGYEVIPDRLQAITRAVEISRPGDVLVVAGKGHEDYQIVGTKRYHFDDREILQGLLCSRTL